MRGRAQPAAAWTRTMLLMSHSIGAGHCWPVPGNALGVAELRARPRQRAHCRCPALPCESPPCR
ncbi:hypothetical protein EBN15_09705 [Xanthomonas cucurbitae]|nr:hypothetical protein EBN15_09705 [Xanthomonas cucurbitae]